MISRIYDWKEVANRYYEKAVTLSILILLFAFLVSPQINVKPYERVIEPEFQVEHIPDLKDPIPPPSNVIKPDIKLVFDESFNEDDPDVIKVPTLDPTTLDPYDIITRNEEGSTNIFQTYEDDPVLIKEITPKYTDLAKNASIEGIVELQVEVFADGSVGAVKVLRSLLSGPGGLDDEAVKAVKQWEFQPAKSNGNPVAVWVVYSIEFKLD